MSQKWPGRLPWLLALGIGVVGIAKTIEYVPDSGQGNPMNFKENPEIRMTTRPWLYISAIHVENVSL